MVRRKTTEWRLILTGLIGVWMVGCQPDGPSSARRSSIELDDKIVITPSASGWSVRRGPVDPETGGPATILVNPKGTEFNVGTTQFPDINTTFLWRIGVKEFHSEFLVLYANPVASGGSTISLFRIANHDRPVRVVDILTHAEMHPRGNNSRDPLVAIVDHPEGLPLRDVLFTDIDHDGVPDLQEDDVTKDGGRVIYHRYDGARFIPTYVEEYESDGKGGARLASRRPNAAPPSLTPTSAPASSPATSQASELSEEQARGLATRLANKAYEGKVFQSGDLKKRDVRLTDRSWRMVEKKDGRWVLHCFGPVGPEATVSFRLDGSDPQVKVDYRFI